MINIEEDKHIRIGILGMGGVGSFIGAKLTTNYQKNKKTKIIFICRGKTKENISNNGLYLISSDREINSNPDLATDRPDEIGLLDILIIATKSFSLSKAINQYQNCLKKETIIIPLQNGVSAKEVISNNLNYKSTNILEGCIYVTSNIEKPGVVNHVGGPGKIFFGNSGTSDFKWVEKILTKGGLDATYTKDIKEILWKKYLFVSPLAAMTTAQGITFGELAESSEHMNQLKRMMYEVQEVAKQYDVTLTDKDVEESLSMLSNFPYQSKSSLQLDFENEKDKTEKYSLVDFIIEKGEQYDVNVDNYKDMNKKIAASGKVSGT